MKSLNYYAVPKCPVPVNNLCLTIGLVELYNIVCVLGDRLVVGRRVLAPSARVRVLLPQPKI